MCPASIFNGDAVKILKDKLRFKTTGEIAWDATNGCPSYPSDIAGVTNQIGQETHVRVYNATGAIIENGSVVYVDGGVDGDGLHPSVAKAIANTLASSRVLGVVTADIAIGAHGIVTIDGLVNSLDTSAYTPGTVLKLSASVAGTYSSTTLTDGNFDTTIGIVVKQHVSDGSILVYNNIADHTAETLQKTGWSNVYGPATIAFDDGTRTLTLTPVGSEFHFYEAGVKYSKTTDSYQIADTEGLHYLYYDAGVITDIINPTNAQVANVLQNFVTIAYIGWDAANNLNIFVGKELHDMQFPSLVHNYNHFAYGARYINGLGPNSIIAEGNGSLDSHAQFGLDAGAIADEDIFLPTSAVTSTAGLPIFYLEGTTATPLLRKTTQAGFAVKTTGTGRLAYNFLNAGNWTVAEVSNSNYVLCHVFCIHENDITKRPIAFMGQAQYSTVALARAGAQTEIAALVTTGIIPQEIKSIATFVFQTQGSYTNSVNARIREISTGVNFIDWRSINNTGGSSASGGSTTTVFSDNSFQIYDDLDATKTFQAQLSSLTTGTNRIGTAPDRNFNMGNISSWVTSTHYLVTDVIKFTDERIYRCAIDHTSGTFATDLNSGNWVALSIDSSDGYNFLAGKIPTSFFAFDDGTAYVDGTGGSPSFISVAASPSPITNEPGRLNLRISKADAGSALGEGVSVDFLSRGTEDYGAMRVIRFKATTSANYIDNAFRFYFYDKTNNVIVDVLGDPDLKASSFVKNSSFEVQFPYSSDLRCSIYCNDSTVTTAYDIDCTWEIVETKQASGPVVSDWKSCIITTGLTGGSGVTVTAWEKRIGDTGHYKGRISWSTAFTGGSSTLTIPRTIDSTKMQSTTALFSNILGTANFNDAGTDIYPARITYNSSNSVVIRVYGDDGGTSSLFVKTTVIDTTQPVTVANADSIEFEFSVPIVGWSSNQVLSEDISLTKTIVEGVGNNSAALTSDVTDVNFTEVIDTAACWDGSGFTADSTCTIVFSGLIRLSTASSASIVAYINGTTTSKLFGGFASTGGYFNGSISLIKGQRFSLRINENRTLSNVPSHIININKLANPQQIPASEVVNAVYTASGSQAISSSDTAVIYETKVTDTHGAYNNSTGTFTCPRSGSLNLSATLFLSNSSNWHQLQNQEYVLKKNGTRILRDEYYVFATQASAIAPPTMKLILTGYPVVKGDVITFFASQTTGTNINVFANSSYNVLTATII
jgi:hypothetical protein